MKFLTPLKEGTILKRYKRFLADIQLPSGEVITAHTANTGSMKTCWEPGWKAIISFHDNPKRKLKYSLEMTHNGKTWIGINTSLPNKLAKEAIENGLIKELKGYPFIKPEVKTGDSRIDLLLSKEKEADTKKDQFFVEIKNVTLKGDDHQKKAALFPDAVSTRGQKHIQELIRLHKEGYNAALLFIVQREDVDYFAPAKEIDPVYSELLKKANKEGVLILAYQCSMSKKEIIVNRSIPVKLNN
ncbi:MAG: DNA/RNA nuclease SfsA [Bdellovibrionota bacterium]|nr:DNA/RNA nuclease SfsA [Bdellovibrionota bacterium]